MLTPKQLKHFEKLAGKSFAPALKQVNILADRTEATDSYSYLVNISKNETPASVEDYPDTKIFIEMLNGTDKIIQKITPCASFSTRTMLLT